MKRLSPHALPTRLTKSNPRPPGDAGGLPSCRVPRAGGTWTPGRGRGGVGELANGLRDRSATPETLTRVGLLVGLCAIVKGVALKGAK